MFHFVISFKMFCHNLPLQLQVIDDGTEATKFTRVHSVYVWCGATCLVKCCTDAM